MAFLSVEQVAKYFPLSEAASAAGRQATFCVFRDVDVRIAKGEFVTVIGHSGCGKSTLLNIIAGFEEASSGGVILDGKEVTEPGLDRMVVFQSFALMPWLSAFDNVRLAVRAARPAWSKAEVAQHTQRYIDMMGLNGAERKKPVFLSGGMRQRVGLARAFAVTPKVLLLDEPFAQIDALTRGVIQEELVRMWTAMRNTVFMVTHDVDEAILLSDRIALMTNGPEARLAECIEVDIPRPRSREAMIDTPQYARLRNYILHFLMQGAHHLPERNGLGAMNGGGPLGVASPGRPLPRRRSAAVP
ncbi:MAG: ATP-binding cassette domain-containing protein [Candidatus Tectomicrobia bacterium]|nr:ATP-binding cassette domain-containing protein [Candidatus Tectomicrobia bacterium]